MSYIRVIPRDLFNEANLLKCLGHLFIALETAGEHDASFEHDGDEGFIIHQSPADGSIFVTNIRLFVAGREWILSRPLNSRAPWPLYAAHEDGDEVIPVFTDEGKLTAEFLALIRP